MSQLSFRYFSFALILDLFICVAATVNVAVISFLCVCVVFFFFFFDSYTLTIVANRFAVDCLYARPCCCPPLCQLFDRLLIFLATQQQQSYVPYSTTNIGNAGRLLFIRLVSAQIAAIYVGDYRITLFECHPLLLAPSTAITCSYRK